MTDYGSPRGSIPRMVTDAAQIAEQRLRLTMRLLDDATDAGQVGTLGGGTRLAYEAFRALLQSDKAFQAQVAARWQFATPQERKRLLDEIRRVFPARQPTGSMQGAGLGLPPEVEAPPGGPLPPGEARGEPGTGVDLGGPGGPPAPAGLAPPPGLGAGAPPPLPSPPAPVTPLSMPPPPPTGSPGPPPPLTALLPGLPGVASQGVGPVDLGTGPLPPISPAQAAPPPNTLPTNPLGPPLPPVR